MLSADTACRACGSGRLFDVVGWPSVPTNSSLFVATEEEARSHPRGSFRLVGCESCGLLFNADTDEALIEHSERSIETQAWSERYRTFAGELARGWVDRWGLAGKTTLEIGCGRTPSFLELMCSLTGGPGIGVDPVVDVSVSRELELVPERFDGRASELAADAVVCRHTLEHVVDVGGFLEGLREWAGRNPDAVHLFEVPDVMRILRESAFWDLYYEHCSYFAPCSLQAAFSLHGFEVEEIRREFDDQYLVLAARPGARARAEESSACGRELRELASSFAARVEATTTVARRRLESLAGDGPLVLWQAGSKAVGFLTATGAAPLVSAVVDANPEKHGLFLVGPGLPIVGVSAIRALAPRHVVVMNEIYLDEIRDSLADEGLEARLHSAKSLLADE